jgi:hypothetical protein
LGREFDLQLPAEIGFAAAPVISDSHANFAVGNVRVCFGFRLPTNPAFWGGESRTRILNRKNRL